MHQDRSTLTGPLPGGENPLRAGAILTVKGDSKDGADVFLQLRFTRRGNIIFDNGRKRWRVTPRQSAALAARIIAASEKLAEEGGLDSEDGEMQMRPRWLALIAGSER